jgi:hypothetical protein
MGAVGKLTRAHHEVSRSLRQKMRSEVHFLRLTSWCFLLDNFVPIVESQVLCDRVSLKGT